MNDKEYFKAYREANKEKARQYAKEYYQRNKDKLKKKASIYYQENRSSILREGQERRREYKKSNRSKYNSYENKRRASKIQRTPVWLNEEDLWIIQEIYELSEHRSKSTGIPHHVDHIIPLQGKNVSGLHVPTNLQIITASENLSKHNYYKVN